MTVEWYKVHYPEEYRAAVEEYNQWAETNGLDPYLDKEMLAHLKQVEQQLEADRKWKEAHPDAVKSNGVTVTGSAIDMYKDRIWIPQHQESDCLKQERNAALHKQWRKLEEQYRVEEEQKERNLRRY